MASFLALAVLVGAATRAVASDSIDLLAGPLESLRPYAWKHFSEEAQTRLSDVWQLREGVLVCGGSPKGYLYLDHDFTNFILRLDWRWPAEKKPGNGGVLIRITGPHKIWPRSLEPQLNAGQAGDFWGLGGFPLDGPADRLRSLDHPQLGKLTNLKRLPTLEKPAGQWNHYEIIADGPSVTLKVNGEEINRATGCDVVGGKICLTAEGDEIHFRHVQLVPKDGPGASGADGGWVSLFNGRDLDGWQQKNGAAQFAVQDGCIVGTSVPNSPNSFLCTTRDYGDFELEFEVKVDAELNSGVQIRSHSLADYQKGRVHGYQVEIAVNGFSGGIYDEARRGKFLNVQPVTPEIRGLLKKGEWNRYRVVCQGDRIQTWVNGVAVTDLRDSMTPSGFIGLQVHGVGKRVAPLEVRWRQLRLRELKPQ